MFRSQLYGFEKYLAQTILTAVILPVRFFKNLKHDVGVQYPGLCLLEAYSVIKYSRGLLSHKFPKGAERVAL